MFLSSIERKHRMLNKWIFKEFMFLIPWKFLYEYAGTSTDVSL